MAPTGRGGRRNHRRNNPKTTSHPTTSRTLPPSLIIQILTHTAPKSLARFKCVSKSWYALITHPLFIKKHVHVSLSTNNHVICNGFTGKNGSGSFRKVVSMLSVSKMPVTLLNIDTGFKSDCDSGSDISFVEFSKNMVLAGSVKGIVLVTHAKEYNGKFVGLWNPGVNKWKCIRMNREVGGGSSKGLSPSFVGLGYDKTREDFKIIQIVTAVNGKWDRIDVYSVSNDRWENVYSEDELSVWSCQFNCNFIAKDVPYFNGLDVMPGSVNSFQHQILAGFDPSTGLLKKIPYPKQGRVEGTWAKPFEYQNSVAIMVQSNPGSPERQTVDMYVLDDNTTIWIKMYSIGPFPSLEYHEPQLSFKTGEIVLKEKLRLRGLYLCDPKANCRTYLTGTERFQIFWSEAYSHSESLVTIEGMELIRNKDKNKNSEPKKMNRTELLCEEFKSALCL